jgi:hypothetical protein
LVLTPRFIFMMILLTIAQEQHPIQPNPKKKNLGAAKLVQGKKWICPAYPKVGKLEGNAPSYSSCKGEFLGALLHCASLFLGCVWWLEGGEVFVPHPQRPLM